MYPREGEGRGGVGEGPDRSLPHPHSFLLLSGMFGYASSFNQPVPFDTSGVTDMYGTLASASQVPVGSTCCYRRNGLLSSEDSAQP